MLHRGSVGKTVSINNDDEFDSGFPHLCWRGVFNVETGVVLCQSVMAPRGGSSTYAFMIGLV